MIKFEVIKKETIEPVEIFTDVKDIKYYKEGIIDYSNLMDSMLEPSLSKIPRKNQTELNTKGTTEFMIVTKTYVRLEENKAII
jgi:hypothetical protein